MVICGQELQADAGVPTQRRVRAMRELAEIVATKRLEKVKEAMCVVHCAMETHSALNTV